MVYYGGILVDIILSTKITQGIVQDIASNKITCVISEDIFVQYDHLGDQNQEIRNNSMALNLQRRPTVESLMKVHIFNYTNWQRVRDGLDEKLHVEDVGPFVYSQQVERVNIKFENDLLSYQERNTFRYRPDRTEGAQFDKLFVPNLPLMGVVSKAIDMNLNTLGQLSMNLIFTWENHSDAFLELPAHKFLWGYDDGIVNRMKPILSLQDQLKFDKFGLLVTKNGTVDDHITINTGENDRSRMNIIEKINGQKHLSFWGNPECNSLEASDGSFFPPHLVDRQQTLHVFFANLCRRLPFNYEKDVENANGIPLYRYRMPIDVFDDPTHNPANQCYCEIDSGTCPPRGVINVTACAMGLQLIGSSTLVSHPHFYLGDPSLREDVTGLNPDPLLHDSYIDIIPTLGISTSKKLSMQINIEVKKTPIFSALSFLKEGLILPVAWIDMASLLFPYCRLTAEGIPEEVPSVINQGTHIDEAAQLLLKICCIAALIISSICLCVMLIQRRR